MILFWVVLTILGLLDPYFLGKPYEQNYYIFSILISTILMFSWFLSDIRDNNFVVGRILKVAVLFIGILALPIYIIKYKGWKTALKSFGKFVLFFVIYLGIFIVQGIYLYGIA